MDEGTSQLLRVELVAMRSPPGWVAPLLLVAQTAAALLIVEGRRVLARRLTSIRTMVELDPGTGCPNRHGFSRMMDEALALAAATLRARADEALCRAKA